MSAEARVAQLEQELARERSQRQVLGPDGLELIRTASAQLDTVAKDAMASLRCVGVCCEICGSSSIVVLPLPSIPCHRSPTPGRCSRAQVPCKWPLRFCLLSVRLSGWTARRLGRMAKRAQKKTSL